MSYPDQHSWEDEQEYWARKEDEAKRDNKSSVDLVTPIFGLFIIAVKNALAFGIFVYAGYILSHNILGESTGQLKTWGLALFFTYLIFCIIYFLKGTIVGLRAKRKKFWILPWVICVLLCCVVPAVMVKTFVSGMFRITERNAPLCIVLSWAAFFFALLYTYNIYSFKTSTAPRFLFWSFALGVKISR